MIRFQAGANARRWVGRFAVSRALATKHFPWLTSLEVPHANGEDEAEQRYRQAHFGHH
jgi:hypothetical protein